MQTYLKFQVNENTPLLSFFVVLKKSLCSDCKCLVFMFLGCDSFKEQELFGFNRFLISNRLKTRQMCGIVLYLNRIYTI